MTRRSHAGQSAESSRFASDQKANFAAGMTLRQYTHGTPRRLPSGRDSTVTLRRPMSLLPMLLTESATCAALEVAEHEAARKHKGRMNQAR